MFDVEVYPEWLISKSIKPEISVFVRGDNPEQVEAAIKSLSIQSTNKRYEIIVVTTSSEVVELLEDLKNPIVRWCIGKEEGYYTARGRLICEFPARYKASPKMLEDLSIIDKLDGFGIAYGKIEYKNGPKRSKKVFMKKQESGKELFLNSIIAYS